METSEEKFLEHLNANVRIAHKVCNVWFQDEDDRKDALQEMIFQLWKSFPAYRGDAKFSTWMYRVCLNTAITLSKRRSNHVRIDNSHMAIPSVNPDKSDQAEALYRIIGGFSPVDKGVILLHLEGYSYDEISSIMGITRSNVSVKLVRIKQKIEQLLKS